MNRDEIAARIAAEQSPGKGGQSSASGEHQLGGGSNTAETDMLLALIDRMRREAAADPARRRDVTVGEFLVDGARVPLAMVEPLQQLTRTEAAALRFAGWGRSNADIAVLLTISEGTARTHLNSAIRKLEMDGMRALIALGGVLFFPLE